MDDKIKIKGLNPISQSNFKESAEFPITQDGETYKASISQVSQMLGDKDSDRFLRKDQKIPNDNINFGEVKEGDKNVVSGGEVHNKTVDNGLINMLPNARIPLYFNYENGVKVVKNKESVTFINETKNMLAVFYKINNESDIIYANSNYSFTAWVDDVVGSYSLQIGDDRHLYRGVAQHSNIDKKGRVNVSGMTDSNSTFLNPNIILYPNSKIVIKKAYLENSAYTREWSYNVAENIIVKKDFKYKNGWISSSGLSISDYYFKTLKTNIIELKNIDYLDYNFLQKTNEIDINVHVVIYDEDYNFLLRTSVLSKKQIKIENKKCFVQFLFDATRNGADINDYEINEQMFSFEISSTNSNNQSIKSVKTPYKIGAFDYFYDFKRNLKLDVLSENEPNPVRYSKYKVMGNGYICLPPNYTHDGTPVRLIIFGHGSGNTEPSLGHYAPYVDYLVKQGYAVADCHAWGKLNGNYIGTQFWGTPTNCIAYQSFYENIVEDFNIKNDGIFLFGKSQGGLQAYGLPYLTSIPIKASCSLAGESSVVGNQHGYDDKDRFACYEDMDFSGLEKDENGKYIGEASVMYKKSTNDYEWTQVRKDYYLKNKNKWMFFNPAMTSIINLPDRFNDLFPFVYGSSGNVGDYNNNHPFMKAAKVAKCPFICFVAKDDMYSANNRMKIQIEAGGGICIMRLLPSGASNPHAQTDKGGPKMDITTDLGYELKDIPIAFVEMLEFFKEYE